MSVSSCLVHSVALALLLASPGLAQNPDTHFLFVTTDSGDASRFQRRIADCELTPAFSELVTGLAPSDPLPVHTAAHVEDVLFGSAFDPRSDAPLFRVDLDEIETLPTAQETRAWRPDSNWALTRCEILAHELAEAIEYRRLWRQQPDTNNAHFRARLAAAHAEGLRREGMIASAQRTRVDRTGNPYMRSGFCNRPEASSLRVVLGRNTETLVFGDDTIRSVEYAPRRDLCLSEKTP